MLLWAEGAGEDSFDFYGNDLNKNLQEQFFRYLKNNKKM